jgi:DNA-binding Xre family transcriptional regulator
MQFGLLQASCKYSPTAAFRMLSRLPHMFRKVRLIADLGFSARHWQQIEAGRPITLTTLLRICEALDVMLTGILAGLDRGSKI